jgi:hypothetical protein
MKVRSWYVIFEIIVDFLFPNHSTFLKNIQSKFRLLRRYVSCTAREHGKMLWMTN